MGVEKGELLGELEAECDEEALSFEGDSSFIIGRECVLVGVLICGEVLGLVL